MAHQDYLIGVLNKDSSIRTLSDDIVLTTQSRQSSLPPDQSLLQVSDALDGKMAVVEGELSGGVLYMAEVTEVLPKVTGALIQSLVEKQLISYADIQNALNVFEDRPADKDKVCALIIGHKQQSPGAVSVDNKVTEFEFNNALSQLIEERTKMVNIQRVYRTTYQQLPADVNQTNADFAISLHCNAFNNQTSGTEVLYYYKSKQGKILANLLQENLLAGLGLNDRGIKARTSEDRGGYLLRYTSMPCVIAEPFFIDNPNDLAHAQSNMKNLADAYVSTIEMMAEQI